MDKNEKIKELTIEELAIKLQQFEQRLEQCEAQIKALDDGLDERIDMATRLGQ
jgi:hypothetical protein